MKKLLTFIIFAICTTFFFGCATIEYQRVVNPDGSIMDTLIFEVDASVSPATANRIVADIYADVKTYYIDPVIAVRDEYRDINVTEGIVLTRERNDSYRTVKVTTTCASEELFNLLNSQILTKVYVQTAEEQQNNASNTGYSVGAFIIKYIQKTANAFGDVSDFELNYNDTPVLDTNFTQKYSQKYGGGEYHNDNSGEFNADDIKLRQMYISSDLRLNSNADYIMESGGFRYHLWELDASKPDEQLIFYYQTANTTGWYILGLGITLFIMVALLVINSIRNKNKPAKVLYGNEESEKENTDVKEFKIKDFDDSDKDI